MTDQEYASYCEHISERMAQTAGNEQLARAGKFRTLGCIDGDVQKRFATDLALAGALGFFQVRGGAQYFLQQLADGGNVTQAFEMHWPCGQFLIEGGAVSIPEQKKMAKELVKLTKEFNRKNGTNFSALVHEDIGTARPFMRDVKRSWKLW